MQHLSLGVDSIPYSWFPCGKDVKLERVYDANSYFWPVRSPVCEDFGVIATFYCVPWLRQQENLGVSCFQEIIDEASPNLRERLGMRWF